MPTVETWSLWLHVAAGTVAVAAGVAALVTTKGGRRHRAAGKLFLAAMAVTVATVFVLVIAEPTSFRIVLTLVAVFSGYLAFSGYRALSRKRPSDTAHAVDWVAAGTVVLACLALGGWGVVWFLDGSSFGLVMAVFGTIGVAFGGQDLWSFRRGGNAAWLISHLQRMLAAFIATVSAVSAVNLGPTLGVLAWLWPTIVGTPLIAYWSNEYESD